MPVSVTVAGQVMRDQLTAKAAGTPSNKPIKVEPVETTKLLSA